MLKYVKSVINKRQFINVLFKYSSMWKVNHIKFVRDADIYRFFHNKNDSTNIRDKRWQQFDSDLKEVIFFFVC